MFMRITTSATPTYMTPITGTSIFVTSDNLFAPPITIAPNVSARITPITFGEF